MRLFSRRRRGSTLVLVLIVATLLSLLAFSTGDLANYASRQSFAERESVADRYLAEGALEALRLQLIRHYESSQMAPRNWLQAVQDDHNYRVYGTTPSTGTGPVDWTAVGLTPLAPPPGSAAVGAASYTALPGVRAWIDLVNFEQGWVEIVAGTEAGLGRGTGDDRTPISVRMRLNIYRNAIFDLVMLTETTNCMFCHLHIKGDVGSIGFFRPGWGSESSGGRNSGNGSQIDGDVYIGDIASDDSDVDYLNDVLEDLSQVNGNDVTGSLFENYRGPYLPEDTIGNDGVPDFPSFDPAEAENRAVNGGGGITVSGGGFGGTYTPGDTGMWVVPFGSDWDNGGGPGSGALTSAPASTSVIDGNMVIVGSDDPSTPITIDGNVFVKGDVIIKGYVEGQGAIYAGRNLYVAGDIRYKDLPSGGYPLADDGAGQAAVQEQVSELRLAARSNIVIGDWTYADASGNIQRVAERQGQDFMKAQFSLDTTRYYEAANDGSVVSNELKQNAAGDFIDDKGDVVSLDYVAAVSDSGSLGNHASLMPARYDAVMAPGSLTRTGAAGSVGGGSFDPWITQENFRGVLGTGQYDIVTFRVPGTSDSTKRAFELGSDWVGAHGADLPRQKDGTMRREYDNDLYGDYGMQVYSGGTNGSTWKGALIAKDTSSKVTWPTQVQHIDAFMFANKRIGGKSDLGNLTVNGGMAAGEIGVLAPGFRNGFVSNSQRLGDSVPSWVFDLYDTNDASHPKNDYGQSTSKTRLYYDYRLRNGGFGFDFFAKTGDTVHYVREGQVAPPRDPGGPAGFNLFPAQ